MVKDANYAGLLTNLPTADCIIGIVTVHVARLPSVFLSPRARFRLPQIAADHAAARG